MKSLLLFLITINAMAQSSFESLWNEIQKNSEQLQSYESEVKLSELESERGSRHWLPKIRAGYSRFQTNDPGAVFFNNLGQAAIEQADFTPATLNEPDTETFSQGQIGIELPLFEGGMKEAARKMMNKNYEASKYEYKFHVENEYGHALQDYVVIERINSTQKTLADLKIQLTNLIQNYSLGSKNNPVGRSGLLGLKGVNNRLEVTNKSLNADKEHRQKILSFKSNQEQIAPSKIDDLPNYLDHHLKLDKSLSKSSRLKSHEVKLEALKMTSAMEQARHLPQVSLFANQNYYAGDRDDNQTQTVGVALRWSLFSPDDYGKRSEAAQRYNAHKKKFMYAKKQEETYKKSLEQTVIYLKSSIKDLENSSKLLNEQAKLAFGLYKRGKVNALQLAEVLNRTIDLEVNKLGLEQELIKQNINYYKLFK